MDVYGRWIIRTIIRFINYSIKESEVPPMVSKDKYKEVKTFNFPNMVARVYIPDLTPEERERRLKLVHDAAAALLRCQEQNTAEKRKNT